LNVPTLEHPSSGSTIEVFRRHVAITFQTTVVQAIAEKLVNLLGYLITSIDEICSVLPLTKHNFAVSFPQVPTFVSSPKQQRFSPVYENRLLRSVFGSKGENITGGWSKLHNEELHKYYSAIILIRASKQELGRSDS
jgi:hypothetical protein